MHSVFVIFADVASISEDSCDIFIHILQGYSIGSYAREVTTKDKHKVRIACINFGRILCLYWGRGFS